MSDTPKFMLDTNICIYIQTGRIDSVTKRFALVEPGEAVISVITWGELVTGAVKSRRSKIVHQLLADFISVIPILPMQSDCGRYYGKIRGDLEKRGTPISNNDLWIAAHAMAANLTLVTNNTDEFERIPGLKVENWV